MAYWPRRWTRLTPLRYYVRAYRTRQRNTNTGSVLEASRRSVMCGLKQRRTESIHATYGEPSLTGSTRSPTQSASDTDTNQYSRMHGSAASVCPYGTLTGVGQAGQWPPRRKTRRSPSSSSSSILNTDRLRLRLTDDNG